MTQKELQLMYDKYMEILHIEINQLKCKPTEVRHLIGRLGEFHCALKTKGDLAYTPNQHGFDVVSQAGKKVSVKTTAQNSGFITINQKTMNQFDKLMVLQMVDLELKELYFGPFDRLIPLCRPTRRVPNKFELDITKLKKLKKANPNDQSII